MVILGGAAVDSHRDHKMNVRRNSSVSARASGALMRQLGACPSTDRRREGAAGASLLGQAPRLVAVADNASAPLTHRRHAAGKNFKQNLRNKALAPQVLL
jgi:hypothetical protein